MRRLLEDRRLIVPLIATTLAIAIGSALVITLTGDAGGGDSGMPVAQQGAKPAGGSGKNVKVGITDFKYGPESVTVKAGSQVTWLNNDRAPHTATGEGIATGDLRKGDSKAVMLSKPGTYAYVCEFHPFMEGKVVVK